MNSYWTSPEIVGAVERLCGLLKLFWADVTQSGLCRFQRNELIKKK